MAASKSTFSGPADQGPLGDMSLILSGDYDLPRLAHMSYLG